jgi:hypothetical protein
MLLQPLMLPAPAVHACYTSFLFHMLDHAAADAFHHAAE